MPCAVAFFFRHETISRRLVQIGSSNRLAMVCWRWRGETRKTADVVAVVPIILLLHFFLPLIFFHAHKYKCDDCCRSLTRGEASACPISGRGWERG